MSLSSSMWASVSGLLAHGDKMGVISNQIANVSTVGFKGSRMDFADLMSHYTGTTAGVGQVGSGVRTGIVMADFSQGSMESTTAATDIAISGNGFFKVKPLNSNTNFYTRAGNFRFDAEGYLTDPNGYVLQGWKVDRNKSQISSSGSTAVGSSGIVGSGIPQNIRLDTFTCEPKHTNNIVSALNLDSAQGNDKSQNEDNPFFSMLTTWDATQKDASGNIIPLGTNAYAYQDTIEIFDEGGQSHILSVYYDRVEKTLLNDITGLEESHIVWEYVVTMDPVDDKRDFDGDGQTLRGTKEAGLLMAGTLSFNSAGQLQDMSAYVPNGSTDSDMSNFDTWVQAPISTNGYPLFCPNFTGRTGASTAWDNTGPLGITSPTSINSNTDGYLVEMNFGMRSTTTDWQGNAPSTISGWTSQPAGQSKVMKSDKSEGTIIRDIGQSSAEIGVVGADGTLYKVKTTAPGTNEVLKDGVVYSQKQSGVDSVGTNEAEDSGFIYAQDKLTLGAATGALPAGDYHLYNDGANNFVYHNGLTYDTSGVAYTTLGPITKVADTATPIASNRPVLDPSGDPIYRYQADGITQIPLVTSTNYEALGFSAERQSTATTSYTLNTVGNNFYEHSKYQDGYTYGDLRYVNVDSSGVMTGTYSNGVSLQLFQITLFDFASEQNLHREGNNLFTETRESGLPTSGAPGTGTFGATESYFLEGSNVDLARELVNMITTQRGFQANSKSVTTVDTMLDTVINMKR